MGTRNPENVVIVGGGVAGWMTASYLKAAFSDRISITLIESGSDAAAAGPLSGDETTFSDFGRFFDFLGLAEEDWMPACNAAYKLAVRVQDWNRPGQHFYHPFEQTRSAGGFPLTEWWLHNGPSGRFDRDCFVVASLCDAGRSPRHLDGSPTDGLRGEAVGGQLPYAYHLDAALLAEYLGDHARGRGVRCLTDEVAEVRLDERGWISHLVTREHGEVHGDLFVDCTGFQGLLINRALRVPFVSYQGALPNDSVVALQVPADMRARGIAPYTTATARSAGWIWTIPLVSRLGTGYVYARDYCSPEEAERTLRAVVGPEAAEVAASHGTLRVGRSRQAWKNNCVAVGASAGFVEPLACSEASFVHHAVAELVRSFPGADRQPEAVAAFNASVARVTDDARDFLALHYQGAAREDSQYWRDTKTQTLPRALAERIERWRARMPDAGADGGPAAGPGLTPDSYACILLGTGAMPLRPSPAVSLADDEAARRQFAEVRDTARALVDTLPSQYEYFAQMGVPA
ncbi:tryptophan halogenase family protein [Streptomyces sp. NPDC002054]|uniref:tryptophan halogenase family protein n=1 Tax=Streptomyces sp. NPDC002054 TaxID=3154663 RepID=UPI0033256A00